MNDSRLQIQQDRAWDIMIIISLVEEHVFTVGACRRELLEYSVWRYAVLSA